MRGMRLGVSFVVLLAVPLATAGEAGARADVLERTPPSLEQEVKAGFLYNFAKFVEWAPDPSNAVGADLTLCVLGSDPSWAVVERSVRGKTANGRAIAVRRPSGLEDLGSCQILYVSSTEATPVPAVLRAVAGKPVLTVGEVDRFGQLGGVVRLYLENRTVRFEINVNAAERAGLRISSKLLGLARITREETR